MVSIEKPVKPTTELLRSLRWFCHNPFSNRRHGPPFSLVGQLYAAYIPKSQRTYMFLSQDYLVAIAETVWILASFNILKERAHLNGRSSLSAWKFVNGEKQNDWTSSFFMKQSAELKGCECTNFPRMAICEEVSHLEMYYLDEGSGLEPSIGG